MKNLIFMSMLFIPFFIVAQNNADVKDVKPDKQTKEWMTKISSNSEMRTAMLNMMIENTKGDKVEMTKLVDVLMKNPEMHSLMMTMRSDKSENENVSINPRIMMNDSVKVMKMYKTTPIQKNKITL